MTPEQKAAYVNAQSVMFLATIAGMIAENEERLANGHAIAHNKSDFERAKFESGLHHNALLDFFHS